MSARNKNPDTRDPKTLPYPLYRRICKEKEGFKWIDYLVGRELTKLGFLYTPTYATKIH